jgi:hypothetical protein
VFKRLSPWVIRKQKSENVRCRRKRGLNIPSRTVSKQIASRKANALFFDQSGAKTYRRIMTEP